VTIADHIFGRGSRAELDTADSRLQRLARWVLIAKDHSVLKGHRQKAEQNAAFDSGASKLRWPDGKHNGLPSKAIDVQTYPRPAPLEFGGDPDKMSVRELRDEVKRLRRQFRDQPLREEQISLLGIYKGVALAFAIPIRTGDDWNRDGELSDNGWDDLFHIEVDE
jgi:hypothetical protein